MVGSGRWVAWAAVALMFAGSAPLVGGQSDDEPPQGFADLEPWGTFMGAAELDGFAYIFGGNGPELCDAVTTGVRRMDLATGSVEDTGHDVPVARVDSPAVAVGGHIFLLGGYLAVPATSGPCATRWEATDTVLRYDPATGDFEPAGTLAAIGDNPAAAFDGTTIYVGPACPDDCHLVRYDPATQASDVMPATVPYTSVPAFLDGVLYAVDGGDCSAPGEAEILAYDGPSDSFVAVGTFPESREYHAVATDGTQLFLVGGYRHLYADEDYYYCDSLGPVYSYDPATGEVTENGDGALPWGIDLSIVAYQGNLYTFHLDAHCIEGPASTLPCPGGVCANGEDDDGDGFADYGDDPGCSDPSDMSELGATTCDNGEDDDGDGVADTLDQGCAGPRDVDEADSYGPDYDRDGAIDRVDNCLRRANPGQADLDGDGAGDACDVDWDGDLVANVRDNCPILPNRLQGNHDRDRFGDVCEPGGADRDADGVMDVEDSCRRAASPGQADLDLDGLGDECDLDWDGDRVPNRSDNCPALSNSLQGDGDRDRIGDACDPVEGWDRDWDAIADGQDNCRAVANRSQADLDEDGAGDACDADVDGDGRIDVLERLAGR